jgi:hypothetical protein
LKEVGLDRYAKSSLTEILMLAYAFNRAHPKLWLPILGEPMPQELYDALMDPTVELCAWNYNFEKDITQYKLGIEVPQERWYDPSVTCANMSLPIGLNRAGQALDVSEQKTHLIGDEKLTKVFSVLTKQKKSVLKKNPEAPLFYFKNWETNPEQWEAFKSYCIQDVIAERDVDDAAIALNCPMTPGEKQAWLLDQRMNENGVFIDQPFVKNAAKMAEDEANRIINEMKAKTGLENPNSGKQLGEWLRARKYPFKSLDADHVDEALKEKSRFKLPPVVVEVLELKVKLGGSAYKKLEKILNLMGEDGRLRDQFVYHGAHTARWAGRGVQLQNLYKSDKEVSRFLNTYTRAIRLGKKIYSANTNMSLVASTIRSAFAAPPGSTLIAGDLAQIESRVLAALAGCQTMIDAYTSGLDLYKDIMAFLLEKPYESITSGERANGKIIILGCFEENTLVLTDSGWKRIVDVAKTDKVFDGQDFVHHGGVIAQGKKGVIPVCGVGTTPDHKFLTGRWVEACRLKENIQLEKQASSLGIGSFLSIDSTRFPLDICASVTGVVNGPPSIRLTWRKGELGHVYPVLIDGFGKNRTESILDGHTSQERSSTDLPIGTMPSFHEPAPPFEAMVGNVMQVEESKTDSTVSTISSGMSRLSPDTNLLNWRLTEKITTDITNGVTFDSLQEPKISTTEVDTFDILNAGPNSRFMILTTKGPMVVHNCGFGMGWEKFIEYAATFGVILDEVTAQKYVKAFRDKYKEIPDYWEALNKAVVTATDVNICVYVKGVVVDGRNPKVLKIKLPSGRCIHYHKPVVTMEPPPWGGPARKQVSYEAWDKKGCQQKRLYGGIICENVVQAVARDILLNGMLEAEKDGFKIIMTIHDEIVSEVLKGLGFTVDRLLNCMRRMPDWAEGMGFVLAAEGWENEFYKK